MNYSKLTDKELIAECKKQRAIIEKYEKEDKLRRTLVEVGINLKELYLILNKIKIHESSNNRRKVGKGI